MLFSRSISHHLLRAALIATMVPLLAMLALSFWQYQRDVEHVERFTGQESEAAARVAGNVLDFLAEDAREALRRVQHALESGAATEALMAYELSVRPQIESLLVTDAEGQVTLTTVGGETGSLGSTPHFGAVRAGAPITFGKAVFSPTLHKFIVPIAMPYRRDGRFAGMVLARLSTQEIARLFQSRLDQGLGAFTYVTDQDGRVIAHPDLHVVSEGRMLASEPPVAAALAGRNGWLKFRSAAGERIAGSLKMPFGWVVVSTRHATGQVFNAGDRLRSQLLVIVPFCLMAGVAALAWGYRLARPLEDLAATMRQVRDTGLKTQPFPTLTEAAVPRAVSEYETLATSYNALLAELGDRFEEIITYQEELQVQQEELQSQNEELHEMNTELLRQQALIERNATLAAERQAAVSHAESLARKNEELARLSAQAQESNRLKSEFLATMSHELRTPLNAIIGYTDLVLMLEPEALSERTLDSLKRVAKNARNLLSLINDVLDLSKIEAGKVSVQIGPYAMSGVLQVVATTAEPLAEAKGLTLGFSADPALKLLEGDETKIQQIVLNLVSNAIKFTNEGGVTVSAESRGADRLAIVVADTGIGIASENRELIFEAFRQVDGGTARKAGGTGLGLAIARRLARLLGGDLTVESALGEGSRFTLELPRRLGAEKTEPAQGTESRVPLH